MNCLPSSSFAIVRQFSNQCATLLSKNGRPLLQVVAFGTVRVVHCTFRCVPISILEFVSDFDIRISDFYSYRSAATGSSLEADQAGAKPEINPVITDTTTLMKTRPNEKWIGNDGNAAAMLMQMA
jgi:hypothetical protein